MKRTRIDLKSVYMNMTGSVDVDFDPAIAINNQLLTEINQIVQDEIDREIVMALKKAQIEERKTLGLYSILFEKDNDLLSNIPDTNGHCTLRGDVLVWLMINLKGRFILYTSKYFVDVYFDGDKEAATLFTLFWL
jgi:hypothetical protein